MSSSDKKVIDERFKQIYKACYTSVYKFTLSRLKNNSHAVEDITQEAFIVLYNKMIKGAPIEYPSAFLLQTANNLIKRYFKELSKSGENITIDEVKEIPTHDIDLDAGLSFEQYSKLFSAALNDEDAELFSLRYIEELEITEIAALTGMNISTVATKLQRIRERLKKKFGDKINY